MPTEKIAIETLEELRQQNERVRTQADLTEKAKPKCRVCGNYTDMKSKPQCFGHGGFDASAPMEELDYLDSEELSEEDAEEYVAMDLDDNAYVGTSTVAKHDLRPELTELPFNPEVISDLLSKHLLIIDSNRDLGVLFIKLLYNMRDLNLSSAQQNELKKFVNSITKEMDEFNKEYKITKPTQDRTNDKEQNFVSLRITMPTADLYAAFILRLAMKNLLPLQNVLQKPNEKVSYEAGKNHFRYSPYTLKLLPAATKKAEEDELQHSDKRNSAKKDKNSIRPKTPLDRLKLKL